MFLPITVCLDGNASVLDGVEGFHVVLHTRRLIAFDLAEGSIEAVPICGVTIPIETLYVAASVFDLNVLTNSVSRGRS